ncbi:response regulator [Streptomyces castrisilvae]|uniref:Response regulator n=1 Tax=Streptomyces castrisilvae TaxID=3033811 RepID=A0ABY9HG40_9ACTN|nr:response regulator [Streptomyces sp. Mut1]WLQ33467.1 response regulator [Streptomyces sp. Mut1]
MAEQLAELITQQTGFRTLACSRPERAVAAVQEHPIRVALLDQRMPVKSGTELYRELREVNPALNAIMITGEASSNEVGQAMSLGFSDYLAKADIARLSEVVLKWHTQYEVDRAAQWRVGSPELLHSERRKFLLFGDRVRYYLAAVQVLDEAHVIPDSWVTVQQINAGQEKKYTYSTSVKETFIVETSHQYNAKGSLAADIAKKSKVGARIEAAVTRIVKKARTTETTATASTEETYRLPEESSDPAENYVKSRHIESAPVYRKLRLSFVKECSCCREDTAVPLVVLVFDDAYATRHTDYYRDGTSEFIDTGHIR